MTPREFLRSFQPARASRPAGTGASAEPLEVEPGDLVGVVLMNLGGPGRREEVEPFLYNRLMDPAEGNWGVPGVVRHVAARILARRRARARADAYEQIGGESPLARHTAEQARALDGVLNRRFGAATGARFRTYVAMRHWHPSTEEAAAQMERDGVTKVVLLPLHPHASAATSGSSVAYWNALCAASELPAWPTSLVPEYAAHPTYIQALAERVDEGLQRFPLAARPGVQVVFCAEGAPAPRPAEPNRYCCLVHATVQQIVNARAARDPRRAAHVAFLRPLVPGRALGPGLTQTLDALAEDGHAHILVVPVSFVSDRVETAYDLDVVVRAHAATQGVTHFEVATGLNEHPLFIETLAAVVGAQVQPTLGGDGATARPDGTALLDLRPRHDPALRTVRCETCTHAAEPCDWEALPDVAPAEAAPRRAA